jgi:hypothetical protein
MKNGLYSSVAKKKNTMVTAFVQNDFDLEGLLLV